MLNKQTEDHLVTKHDLELLKLDLKLWIFGGTGILGLLLLMIFLKLSG